MALKECPECSKKISEFAVSCPNCGFPVSNPPSKVENSRTSELAPSSEIQVARPSTKLDTSEIHMNDDENTESEDSSEHPHGTSNNDIEQRESAELSKENCALIIERTSLVETVESSDAIVYSGATRRLSAYTLDIMIITCIAQPFSYLVIGVCLILGSEYSFLSVSIIIELLVSLLYFARLESTQYRATIGKQLLGLEINRSDGSKITFLRSLSRYFVPFVLPSFLEGFWRTVTSQVSGGLFFGFSRGQEPILGSLLHVLVVLFGFSLVLFTQKKQSLFDIATDSIIVRKARADHYLHRIPVSLSALMLSSIVFIWSFLIVIETPFIEGDRFVIASQSSGGFALITFVCVFAVRKLTPAFPIPSGSKSAKET